MIDNDPKNPDLNTDNVHDLNETMRENLGDDLIEDPEEFEDMPHATGGDEENTDPQEADPLAALTEENAALKDKVLRTMAEMENVRRRAVKERDDASKYGISNMAKELLSVADNMARAMESAPEDLSDQSEPVANLITGIQATHGQLLSAMEKMGIKPVAAEPGMTFDPNVHEVMFEVDSPEHTPGSIVQVMESGYMIHERLLRPARVGVAKKNKPADTSVDVEA